MMEPDCGGPLMKTTSSVHLPLGYSAQVWVVMKGHFVNPSTASSSFGRSDRIMDLSTAFVIIHNHLRYERRHKINVWVLSYHFFTNLALWKPHNHAYYNISIFPLLIKKFILCTLLVPRLRTKSVNEILRNT